MDLTLQSLLAEAAIESPFPIIITDRDGLIEYINPAFTQVTGYALSELKGKTPRVFKSPQTSSLVHKHLWENILEGKVWQGEVCNRKKMAKNFGSQSRFTALKIVRAASRILSGFGKTSRVAESTMKVSF